MTAYKVIETHDIDSEFENLIVLLPGRMQKGISLLSMYKSNSNFANSKIIAIEPDYEWYPIPNGAKDQANSIKALYHSVPNLESFILETAAALKIDQEKITLVGFSAGAVMAIQVAALSERPYQAIVCHNGAILSPEGLPSSTNETPFLLIHNKDDSCFSWDERYIPMKDALLRKDYNVQFIESEDGGHFIQDEDVEISTDWLKEIFSHS